MGVHQDPVRVAMIGAGGMARRVHYPSLASFSDVKIAAICDLNPVKLAAAADVYGVEHHRQNTCGAPPAADQARDADAAFAAGWPVRARRCVWF